MVEKGGRFMIRLTIAKSLIVLGALLGIQPLAVFFSVPIYAIGVLLLWKTTMGRSVKLRWTLMPLVAIAVVWMAIVIISKALGR